MARCSGGNRGCRHVNWLMYYGQPAAQPEPGDCPDCLLLIFTVDSFEFSGELTKTGLFGGRPLYSGVVNYNNYQIRFNGLDWVIVFVEEEELQVGTLSGSLDCPISNDWQSLEIGLEIQTTDCP